MRAVDIGRCIPCKGDSENGTVGVQAHDTSVMVRYSLEMYANVILHSEDGHTTDTVKMGRWDKW